jgi:3-hydroxyacyl-[acyl-carrier-protein] dehydratase
MHFAETPHYDVEQIMQLLPHRFPFLLVDRVERVEQPVVASGSRVGWKLWATKCVSINEPFFPGHFPHKPVMPGVLQVEAMAQAAALICVDLKKPKLDVLIGAIRDAKFRKSVVPGDVLEIYSEVKKDRGSIVIVNCRAVVRGAVVAEAEILAKMFPLVDPRAKN